MRHRDYPAEWDAEPVDPIDEADPVDYVGETPDGRDVDDAWHAVQAEIRDTFLHPREPWE